MSKRTFEAWHGATIFKAGIGQVLICRHDINKAETEAGVFLVDMHCLGVKNGFYTRFPTSSLAEMREKIFRNEDGGVPISPACARKLVEDAVAYAHSLGFAPHADYKHAARVLGGLNARDCDQVFTFGRDGKPLYTQGPHDSDAFAHRVITVLRSRLGEGNYYYIRNVGGSFATMSEAEDSEDEEG